MNVDDVHFLTCIKYGLWGSNKGRFGSWLRDDLLVFALDKTIAGMAQVSGEFTVSEERIWEKGQFPYRIPINFVYAFSPENRPLLAGEIKDAIISSWGKNYGLSILVQRLVQVDSADRIAGAIRAHQNELLEIQKNVNELLRVARVKKEATNKLS